MSLSQVTQPVEMEADTQPTSYAVHTAKHSDVLGYWGLGLQHMNLGEPHWAHNKGTKVTGQEKKRPAGGWGYNLAKWGEA